MRSRPALAVAAVLLAASPAYRTALPGYRYQFPRDHFNHEDFQTEWWYWTGNLRTAEGRRFGFELTFFRQGVDREPWGSPSGCGGLSGRRLAGETACPTVWEVRDGWLAHLALSDIDGGRFLHTERLNRAGPGLAGADPAQARVWNGNWKARWTLDAGAPGGVAAQRLEAVAERFGFTLTLRPEKPPVIHGIGGVSQKAAGEGNASHYVSFTRLAARGEISMNGQRFVAEGLAWMDHEFFTHQLSKEQSGWDWLSLQFADGTDLMLFRLRRGDGTADPYSAGTYVDAQGRARHLAAGDFSLIPGKTWNRYPVEWRVRVPGFGIDEAVTTRLPEQEMTGRMPYWEGAVEAAGSRAGAGYLEMTGYTAASRGPLSWSDP